MSSKARSCRKHKKTGKPRKPAMSKTPDELIQKMNSGAYNQIVFCRTYLDIPLDELQVMSQVTCVFFNEVSIQNKDFLRFDKWCPNLTKLSFNHVDFRDDVYQAFTSFPSTFLGVKELSFHHDKSMESLDTLLEAMDERFPSLEHLTLLLDVDDDPDYKPMWDTEQPYYTDYFKNLKKLSMYFAVGDEYNAIFDYMNISNEKLEKLFICQLNLTDENLKWIQSCTKLRRLSLTYEDLGQDELNGLMNIKQLKTLKLKTGRLHCDANYLISFVRNILHLDLLSLHIAEPKKQQKIDVKFKKMVVDLVKELGQLVIKVVLGKGIRQREITISESGLVESEELDELSSGEETDDETTSTDGDA